MRTRAGTVLALGVAAALSAASAPAQDFPVTEPAPAPRVPPVGIDFGPGEGRAAPEPVAPSRPRPRPARPAPPPEPPVDPYFGPPALAEFVGPPDPPPEILLAPEPGQGVAYAALKLLERTIEPGTRANLAWKLGQSFDGHAVTTPVQVVHGAQPGPTLCLTAAVHGDELNGVEIVRRVLNDLDPKALAGSVIGVPIVNLFGFSRASRYLPDRRDLNRFFPGSPNGSAASRIAFSFFKDVVQYCDALVDFHTGSFDRANLPQVRGDLTLPTVLEFTRGFGATAVLHSPGTRGMLRLAATDHGIPAVTFEVGAPLRLEPDVIDAGVEAVHTLMNKMGMTRVFRMRAEPQATFYESKWVRVDRGGMLFSAVALGDRVRSGQRLGKVVDPVRNEEHEIVSPFRGRVIGMALNQVVLPGFAAYHIGIETSEEEAVQEAIQAPASPDGLERLEGDQMIEGLGDPRGDESAAPLDMGPPVLEGPESDADSPRDEES